MKMRDIMRLMEEIEPDQNQIEAFPSDTLPMDNASRIGRAKTLGFDVNKLWYHGSPRFRAIRQLDPKKIGANTRHPGAGAGFYFTDNPKEAVEYGLRRPLSRDLEFDADKYKGQIMGGFYLKMQHAFYLKENIDTFTEMFGGLWGDPDRAAKGVAEWVAELKQDGYDGIIATQDAYGKQGRHAIIFAPNQARSEKAAFDPSRGDDADLMA